MLPATVMRLEPMGIPWLNDILNVDKHLSKSNHVVLSYEDAFVFS